MFTDDIPAAVTICAGFFFSIAFKKLTIPAACAGGIVAALLYIATGYSGLAMMTAFFILGSAATSWKIKRKQGLGLAEMNKGKRSVQQVIANAGVAAVLAMAILLMPAYENVFMLMIASSFAAATADTVSSELGNIYASRYYNVITFKKDQRGLDGVISIEGTLLGICGAALLAMLYAALTHITGKEVATIIIAGAVGNYLDSILGATVERKGLMKNNVVNFLNTLAGALVSMLLQT